MTALQGKSRVPQPVVDASVFRDVIGRFASGVAVITTVAAGRRYGTTASAVTSLSLEPPMLIVCLNSSSSTGVAIRRSGRFAVNVLAEDQVELASRFATKAPDKFAGVPLCGETDVPLLDGAIATIECRVRERARGGTHVIFIADVEQAVASSGAPLAYFRGAFGRWERIGARHPAP